MKACVVIMLLSCAVPAAAQDQSPGAADYSKLSDEELAARVREMQESRSGDQCAFAAMRAELTGRHEASLEDVNRVRLDQASCQAPAIGMPSDAQAQLRAALDRMAEQVMGIAGATIIRVGADYARTAELRVIDAERRVFEAEAGRSSFSANGPTPRPSSISHGTGLISPKQKWPS